MNRLNIDFSELMDLRVDYAFKLFFATGDTSRLVSLLNAIFAAKNIARVITSLQVVNPHLEKMSGDDKLSVLDIRAVLSDGSSVCIEMHLYALAELKYKMLRSWARIYSEELKTGDLYQAQSPVICIAFTEGAAVVDGSETSVEKIHALYQWMERDDHHLLTKDAEIHFINMKAFLKMLENGEPEWDALTRWLALITHQDIPDQKVLQEVCVEEEMRMAVETLMRFSQDQYERQAYQRRLDELHAHKRMELRLADAERRATDSERQNVQLQKQLSELLARLDEEN